MDRTVRRREINLRIIADATYCAQRTMRLSLELLLSRELQLGTITRKDYDTLQSYIWKATDALDAMKRYASVNANKLEIDQRRAEEASAVPPEDNEFNSMHS